MIKVSIQTVSDRGTIDESRVSYSQRTLEDVTNSVRFGTMLGCAARAAESPRLLEVFSHAILEVSSSIDDDFLGGIGNELADVAQRYVDAIQKHDKEMEESVNRST